MKKLKRIVGVGLITSILLMNSMSVFAATKCYNPCSPTQTLLHKYVTGTNAQGLPTLTMKPGCC